MEQELFKILRELKQIQPNADYSKRSRALILGAKTFRHWQWIYSPKFAMVTAMAVVLILMISGSFYYIKIQSNQEDLVVRASELNSSIQIKLNEIKYFIENDQISPGAISTIQTLLEEATNDLQEASKLSLKEEELEKSLQKLKLAQEILLQIDSLLKQ